MKFSKNINCKYKNHLESYALCDAGEHSVQSVILCEINLVHKILLIP